MIDHRSYSGTPCAEGERAEPHILENLVITHRSQKAVT